MFCCVDFLLQYLPLLGSRWGDAEAIVKAMVMTKKNAIKVSFTLMLSMIWSNWGNWCPFRAPPGCMYSIMCIFSNSFQPFDRALSFWWKLYVFAIYIRAYCFSLYSFPCVSFPSILKFIRHNPRNFLKNYNFYNQNFFV